MVELAHSVTHPNALKQYALLDSTTKQETALFVTIMSLIQLLLVRHVLKLSALLEPAQKPLIISTESLDHAISAELDPADLTVLTAQTTELFAHFV